MVQPASKRLVRESDLSNPASAAGQALSATIASRAAAHGRATPYVYDDFTTQTDGALSGRTPIVGSAWFTTGANPTQVASGSATSSGVGYAVQTLAAKARVIMCEVAFTTTDSTMTMASCLASGPTLLDNFVHFNFGATGYSVTTRRDGALDGSGGFTFDSLPGMDGSWQRPLATDGSETGRFWMILRRDTLTVIGPDSIPRSVTDPRVGALSGNTVFWEPNAGAGGAALLKNVMAMASDPAQPNALVDLLLDMSGDQIRDGVGAVQASRGGYGQVAIGFDASSGLPTVSLGAAQMTTRLTSAASIGATSINTTEKIPAGASVRIESGNAKETKTRTGAASTTGTGSAPYASALTASLTKAHPVGSVVVVTSAAVAAMTYNPDNGFFNLPNLPVLIAPGGKLYLGTGLVAHLAVGPNNTIEFNGNGGRFPVHTTTSRNALPLNAFNTGVTVYDSTLHKLVTYDFNGGAPGWRDGTGTAV